MQQEDDLRALAKIMEFGRAVSIFILVVHVYVYCYPSMTAWHLNLEVIDRILMNFDRTTGIFGCILWTKLLSVLLLAISCVGTIGVKGETITWQRIWMVLTTGAVLFFDELVAAGFAFSARGCHLPVCGDAGCRVSLPAHGRSVDQPPLPAQPDGGCVQHGK